MRLTSRGIAWLVGGLALVGIGFLTAVPEVIGIASAAIAMLGVGALLVVRGRRVTVSARIPSRVERGAAAEAVVSMPAVAGSGLRITTRRGVPVTSVRWRDDAVQITLPTQRRGLRPVGPWRVERIDAWGLFVRRLAEVPGAMLLVTPRVHPIALSQLPMAFVDRSGASEAGTTTFASLREYVIGDDIRHIHWRSSAKTGTLMTRQYIDITRPHLTVVLVNDARAHRDDDAFEEAVDLAASVCSVALAAGFEVALRTTSGERLRAGNAASMLESLATVEPSPTVDRGLQRLPAATTLVVAGHGERGWWDRIPAAGVLRS
jgi:uncharacterized protein (DUF58 family)